MLKHGKITSALFHGQQQSSEEYLHHLHWTQIKLKTKAKTVEVFHQSGGIISTTTQVSPPNHQQNYAQICKSGGSGDTLGSTMASSQPLLFL
jgi:hypothetical protein